MYGHLSRLAVADKLKRYSRFSSGGQPYTAKTQSCNGWGLHSIPCYHSIGELLPRLSILTVNGLTFKSKSRLSPSRIRRFISVALSLKSPSPDVIRHPVQRCSDFPHSKNAPRPYNKLKSYIYYSIFHVKSIAFLHEKW